MADERYHEFHLEGKQLVFLSMAATAVVVVSFLCGVMVGRGVESPGPGDVLATTGSADDVSLPEGLSDLDDVDDVDDVEVAEPGEAPPRAQTLTYFEHLTSDGPVAETLRPEPRPVPAAEAPPVARVPASLPPPADPAPAVEPRPANAAAEAAPGGGVMVQVGSYSRRAEADSVRQRLAAKGYPSFIEPAPNGLFRVRVGPYPDRPRADATARRLEREEQFASTWVVP